MRSILLAIVLLLLVTGTAASARPSPQVARLRHQLHNMTLARNALKSQLVSEQTKNASLASEVAHLQAQVAQLVSARNAALAEAESLRAQLASIPTPFNTAITQVQHEVAYSEGVLSASGVPYVHEQLLAQAAMDYVVGHVSAPAYGFIVGSGSSVAPTANSVLSAQAGICGDAALAFAALAKALGLPVRSVQFYYGPNGAWGHIADEVQYSGEWHYFDPTFGIEYVQSGDVLSIADARASSDPASLLQSDGTLFWTTVVRQDGDSELADVSFATDPATDVQIDQQPF